MAKHRPPKPVYLEAKTRDPSIPPLNHWAWDIPQLLPSYKELMEKEDERVKGHDGA